GKLAVRACTGASATCGSGTTTTTVPGATTTTTTTTIPSIPGTCCQLNDFTLSPIGCADYDATDAASECAALGGTLAAAGLVCDGATGTCAATRTGYGMCCSGGPRGCVETPYLTSDECVSFAFFGSPGVAGVACSDSPGTPPTCPGATPPVGCCQA